jgi:lysozyme family protein
VIIPHFPLEIFNYPASPVCWTPADSTINITAIKGPHRNATNLGVITIATWKQVGQDKDGDGDIDTCDVWLLTWEDGMMVLRQYWGRWSAEQIRNQAVVNMLVDWVWSSGKWGIVIPQRLLHVPDDGIVGPVTLAAVDDVHPQLFLRRVYSSRVMFLYNIVKKDPTKVKYFRGWICRLNDFVYLLLPKV